MRLSPLSCEFGPLMPERWRRKPILQPMDDAELGGVERPVRPVDRRSDDARATCGDYGAEQSPPGIWLGASVED